MENQSILGPSSGPYQNYITWGKDYISTLGNKIVTVGSKVYESHNLEELKSNLIKELWSPDDLPLYQAKKRFAATMQAQKTGDNVDIETSLNMGFEGARFPVWPTLHRTHVITNQQMIASLLQETRGGKFLDFGDYDTFNPVIGSQNMLMCDFKEHTKLRKPLEKSFTHKAISSEQAMSNMLSLGKQHIVKIMQIGKEQPFLISMITTGGTIGHFGDPWKSTFESFVNLVNLGMITDDEIDIEVVVKLRDLLRSGTPNLPEDLKLFTQALNHLNSSENSLLSVIQKLDPSERQSTLLLLIFAASMTTKESIGSFRNLITVHPKYKDKILTEFKDLYDLKLIGCPMHDPKTILDLIGSDSEHLLHEYLKRKDTLLHYCYLESQRLLPAIPVIRRKAKEDFNIGDTQVFKGDLIELNIMAAQRDPKIWGEDADKFNPERFRDPEKESLLNNFSRGRTPCLGKHLAEMEIKVMGLIFCNQVIGLSSPWGVAISYETNDGVTLTSKFS